MENFVTKMNSSAIDCIEYEPKSEMLRVTFTNGGRYDYPKVPQSVIEDWVLAKSAGKFFNQYVKQYAKK